MRFIYPEFLFALSALAIPIIVHLFNFRRFKKIYFTNVRFLKEIKQDTQSRSRLKHLLVLISRLLALTFLVFAFAQPFIPSSFQVNQSGQERISIYIDNSFSMDAVGKNGNLLEQAKKRAREIASAYKPSDQMQLITTEFEGRHQHLTGRDEFKKMVDEVKPGSAAHSLSEVVQRQEQALAAPGEKYHKVLYLISDFQKSTSDLSAIQADSATSLFFVPLSASGNNNLSIDSCFLEKPFVQLNVASVLHVKVHNFGTTDAENIPVKLTINGIQKSVGTVNVAAGTVGELVMSFTLNEAGWQRAAVSITDYPVTFDDDFYFSFNLRPFINVLSINGQSSSGAIRAVFSGDPYFHLKESNVSQIDYSSFSSQQLILLNEVDQISSGLLQELQKYVSSGGSVFIIPSDKIDFSSYRSLSDALEIQSYELKTTASDKVNRIEVRHPLFNDVFEKGKSIPENVDLPAVNNAYLFSKYSGKNSQPIMTLQSGNPFLISTIKGKGNVYVLASSLSAESGNFSRHALFVPVMLRSALRNSSEFTVPMVIGNSENFSITDTIISPDNVFHLVNDKLKFDIIPETKLIGDQTVLSVHNQVKRSGNYEVKSGDQTLAVVSFNFNREESDPSTFSENELNTVLTSTSSIKGELIDPNAADLSHTIQQIHEGRRFWKYCILAALFFFALEVVLIRFYNPTTKKA